MSPESLLQTYFVGSLLLMALGLLLLTAFMGVWIAGLVHCLKHRQDRDRIVWVIVTLFGGPLGAVIYFAIGRTAQNSPPVPLRDERSTSEGESAIPQPAIDHAAMADPRKRAASIQDALWQEAASRRGRR